MRPAALLVAVLAVFLLSACAMLPLPGKKGSGGRSHVYLLETRLSEPPATLADRCRVVIVNPPENAPGQNGVQMLYQRKPYQLERFAYSRWAASPAVMFEPLLLDALRDSNSYKAVLSSPAPVRGDLRIENDGLWLIQKFEGKKSEVELRMSSRLYAPEDRKLVATRDFDYSEPADEATAEAGVAAADRALQRLLNDFSAFVADTASKLAGDCLQED